MRWTDALAQHGYDVLSQLGAGGMGNVYRVRHRTSHAEFALKLLATRDPDLVLRFAREAEAMARVDRHPNVLRVHSTGQVAGHPYLVMDLAPGGDLAQRLEREPVDPATAAEWVAQLADGVAHLHALGVLHRDLKPQNVLFDAQDRPVLTDFGLAKLTDGRSLTRSQELLGTPAYMAPEQAEGTFTPSCDVYGLGAILYTCLTGRPPFEGPTTIAILHQALTEPPTPPRALQPRIPAWLERLCLRTLSKPPRQRPGSAQDLAHALRLGPPAAPARWKAPLIALALGTLVASVWGWTRPSPPSSSAPSGRRDTSSPSSPRPNDGPSSALARLAEYPPGDPRATALLRELIAVALDPPTPGERCWTPSDWARLDTAAARHAPGSKPAQCAHALAQWSQGKDVDLPPPLPRLSELEELRRLAQRMLFDPFRASGSEELSLLEFELSSAVEAFTESSQRTGRFGRTMRVWVVEQIQHRLAFERLLSDVHKDDPQRAFDLLGLLCGWFAPDDPHGEMFRLLRLWFIWTSERDLGRSDPAATRARLEPHFERRHALPQRFTMLVLGCALWCELAERGHAEGLGWPTPNQLPEALIDEGARCAWETLNQAGGFLLRAAHWSEAFSQAATPELRRTLHTALNAPPGRRAELLAPLRRLTQDHYKGRTAHALRVVERWLHGDTGPLHGVRSGDRDDPLLEALRAESYLYSNPTTARNRAALLDAARPDRWVLSALARALEGDAEGCAEDLHRAEACPSPALLPWRTPARGAAVARAILESGWGPGAAGWPLDPP